MAMIVDKYPQTVLVAAFDSKWYKENSVAVCPALLKPDILAV